MLKKSLAIVVVSLCLLSGKSGMALGQSSQTGSVLSRQAEQIKKKVEKIAIGEDIAVHLRSGGELCGAVSRIGDESFEIAEVDLKQNITVKYGDVKRVWKGYGKINHSTGRRVNPRSGLFARFAIMGGMIAIAFFRAMSAR
ncbi:MAG: hypothetical protein L0229_03650 [Blastocatellia bacterium]|nr:hypothetical protein [Blastocatellia bacterium]